VRGGRFRRSATRRSVNVAVAIMALLGAVLSADRQADAATPLNVYVGYMDTHTLASSSNQPTPWPYTDPTQFVGSPCSGFGTSRTCWDAAAVRLSNPGTTDVTGVHAVVVVGSSTYDLWGSSLTVKAGKSMVVTETGNQNSGNLDLSDKAPNAYNGGNTASCANSGAIPSVRITISGTTTTYTDSNQILNTGGVDGGHCLNGTFKSSRMDESHLWTQIGTASPTAPGAPQSLAAVADSGSISLSWQIPASDGGGGITGYRVYRGTSSGSESTTALASVSASSLAYTDSSVANGTTYFYVVKAYNGYGTSGASNEVSATPVASTASPPSAPQNLTASPGQSVVTLTWSAPATDGGAPVTSYNVYRGTSAGGEGTSPYATNLTALTLVDKGTTNGTTYFYRVAAVNSAGEGALSVEASATPQATAPSVPTSLVASAGDSRVDLSWQMPADDGGSSITGYNVYRATTPGGEGGGPYQTGLNQTQFTDSAATNGVTYYYTVTAVNAVGESQASSEASATPRPAPTPPSAPTNVSAVAGNASVQLSWTPPASDGGAAVTGYDVYRGTTSGGEAKIATLVTALQFVDTGRTNGTTYYYEVSAVNAAGEGPLSGEVSATPQATAPTAPQNPTVNTGNAQLGLAWSVPASDGGAALQGYRVYRGTLSGGEATAPIADITATSTSWSDTSVLDGSTYYYQVTAYNSAGESPRSTEVSGTPQPRPPSVYAGRIGAVSTTTTHASLSVPVSPAGIQAGDTAIVSLFLYRTALSGTVTAKDAAGNLYSVVSDLNDGGNNRTLVLASFAVRAVPGGGSITVTFPSASKQAATADEFTGMTGLDLQAGATGTTSAYSSGQTAPTSQAVEMLVGVVESKTSTAPAWSGGWTALTPVTVSGYYLSPACQLVTTTGRYAATGTTGGKWIATVTAMRTP